VGVKGINTGSRLFAGTGVVGIGEGVGVLGDSTSDTGVHGQSTSGTGVLGLTFNSEAHGVVGSNNASVGGVGVFGVCRNGWGVFGRADTPDGVGVVGQAPGTGVSGSNTDGTGVSGSSTNGTGVLGASTFGHAGLFQGRVHVTGALTQGGGGVMIDHPLDPTNKTLAHSFVESPDMMNVYNGNVTTDANGEANVTLPAYFEALNQDFRYQLTVIGQFAQAIVAQEIRNNQFTIKTDQPRVKVSWQVTGIRQDPWAVAHRMAAEEEKAAENKGRYLHPELWGQPEEAGVHRSPPRLDHRAELPRLDRARLKAE